MNTTKSAEILTYGSKKEQKLVKLTTTTRTNKSDSSACIKHKCVLINLDGKKVFEYEEEGVRDVESGTAKLCTSKISCYENFFVREKDLSIRTADGCKNGYCWQAYTYYGAALACGGITWKENQKTIDWLNNKAVEYETKEIQ